MDMSIAGIPSDIAYAIYRFKNLSRQAIVDRAPVGENVPVPIVLSVGRRVHRVLVLFYDPYLPKRASQSCGIGVMCGYNATDLMYPNRTP